MAIGVLTWKLHNFGTALQAYALVSYINENCEEECRLLNSTLPGRNEIIQVNPKSVLGFFQRIRNRIKAKIKSRNNTRSFEKNRAAIEIQRKRFVEFYERTPNDSHKVCVSEKEYFNQQYRKVVVGSDQVWNPKFFNKTYFLDFVDSTRRFSYAPSIGVSTLSLHEKNFLQENLAPFCNISVREKTGKALLQELFPERKINQVLDPTLLFSGEEWIEKLGLQKNAEMDPFILVYTLSDNYWYKDAIKTIRNKLGIVSVIYVTPNDTLFFYEGENLAADLGPREFLQLLYNAKYVVTDSFHGVCFSVNMKIDFSCLQRFDNSRGGENSRVYDFLNDIGLDARIVKKGCIPTVSHINYEKIREKIHPLREYAKSYLDEIIHA